MSSINNSIDQRINKIISEATTYIQSNVAAGTMSVKNGNAISDIIVRLLNVIAIFAIHNRYFNDQQAYSVSITSNVSATSNSTSTPSASSIASASSTTSASSNVSTNINTRDRDSNA